MKYRAELDGLRAIAVIPVILFHAGFSLFSGGFVGVDIFFVISGYLITTIILNEKEQDSFSLINFYERRARRILPALFMVMLVSVIFAWFWLVPHNMKDFSASLIAVSTYTSNILFWRESGYWAPVNELKPLLHTWSLAIEEQYYILFPLFLMLMWKLRKRWIFTSLLMIMVLSLLLAQWGSDKYPVPTFFLLPTRAWELAIGAGIAFYFIYKKDTMYKLSSNRFVDEIFAFIGLVMIWYAIFTFSKNTPFPSFYTLIPTIGAGLIIIFATTQTFTGRLLSTKPFVAIGLISYSTYLWHQPLFSFVRNKAYLDLTDVSEVSLIVLSLFSILLGYFSWRYIEKPFRAKNRFKRKTIFIFALVGTIFFIVIGYAGYYTNGFSERFNVKQSILNDFVGNSIRKSCDINANPYKGQVSFCKLGVIEENKKIDFAVFGDSHSGAMLPAFDIAAKISGVQYVHIGLAGCPPLLGIEVASGNYRQGICRDLALRQLNYVKNNHIKKVFLVARWTLYTESKDILGSRFLLVDKNNTNLTTENSRMVFKKGLLITLEAYRKLGVELYIVKQIPKQKINPEQLYYNLAVENFSDMEIDKMILKESALRSYVDSSEEYNTKIFNELITKIDFNMINLDKYYCNNKVCLIGDRNHSYYLDDDHLSIYGAKLTKDELIRYIKN